MKTASMSVMIACAVTTATFAASPGPGQHRGYLVDRDGRVIMSGASGLCVRDSDWTLERAIAPCDPKAVATAAEQPPAPAQAIAQRPPAATTAAAQAAPASKKFSFSADALFAFDKSSLEPAGKEMLDDLVRQLAGVSYATIVATGHTDRFGGDGYNQRLSERRANVVKDYLMGKNIAATRIEAEGRGKGDPITKASDCPGPRSARVIACLQRDRRVDVEITGATIAEASR